MDKKYILGIALTFFVLITNQFIIQYYMYQKKYDSKTINVAGRQRMLSQSISLEFFKSTYYNSAPYLNSALHAKLQEWRNSHLALYNGSVSDEIKSIENEKAIRLMHKLSFIIDSVFKTYSSTTVLSESSLERVDKGLQDFLTEMDLVVKLIEIDSQNKLWNIVVTEVILFLLTAILITLEVIYIYKPISKKLEYNNRLLERHNSKLKKIAFVQAHKLRAPLTSIMALGQLLSLKLSKSEFSQEVELLEKACDELDAEVNQVISLAENN